MPTRNFDVVKKWSYLLFEEFFLQGDLEKEENLPVSFLCDRQKDNIPVNQPGFINFIVIPLFSQIVQLMPSMKASLEEAKKNCENWKTYQETEEDKKVYTKTSSSEGDVSK